MEEKKNENLENQNNQVDDDMSVAKKKLKKKIPVLVAVVLALLFGVVYGFISESCFIQDLREPSDVDVKPVIYLYPEEELELVVKLPTVDFITTYPLYKGGWNVVASPDGRLTDKNNREYNYLYWEGYTNYKVDLSEGFVVSKDKYIDFLEDKLEYVGLSDKEACDFISYWLPLMNEYDYCLVSFQKDYSEKVKIEYSVEPNNELVVFTAIQGLDESIQVVEQDLSSYKDFVREGFVSVEWGGRFIE